MNRKIVLTHLLALTLSLPAVSQNVFTIEQIIERAKQQSPFSKQAETQKETSYWQYRSYRTNYNPQLRLNGNVPTYYNSIRPITQPDGTIEYLPLKQTNPFLNFGLQQPISFTGGTISANTNFNYFSDLNAGINQWNATVLNLQLTQPIFAYNQLKWDKRIKPIQYEESKRIFAERQESISSEVVGYFFDVLQQQVNEQIARFNLANNDTIYKIEQGRYNIGTTSQDKLLQVELQLLQSRQDVAQARLQLESARLQLRTYIGLKDGDSFDLVLPEEIPQFEISMDQALEEGRKNRADYIAFERRRIEAESEVAQAKGQRYNTTLSASYGLNNLGTTVGDLYDSPTKQQIASISFNVPLVDWGRRKALMQTAYATKKLKDYVIEQDQVNFEQEIKTQVRQFEVIRLQIDITKKADQVAQQRYLASQNSYLIGKIDITNLGIALREKDAAKRNYLQALKTFWTSHYNLRRLTLYDFSTQRPLYMGSD